MSCPQPTPTLTTSSPTAATTCCTAPSPHPSVRTHPDHAHIHPHAPPHPHRPSWVAHEKQVCHDGSSLVDSTEGDSLVLHDGVVSSTIPLCLSPSPDSDTDYDKNNTSHTIRKRALSLTKATPINFNDSSTSTSITTPFDFTTPPITASSHDENKKISPSMHDKQNETEPHHPHHPHHPHLHHHDHDHHHHPHHVVNNTILHGVAAGGANVEGMTPDGKTVSIGLLEQHHKLMLEKGVQHGAASMPHSVGESSVPHVHSHRHEPNPKI